MNIYEEEAESQKPINDSQKPIIDKCKNCKELQEDLNQTTDILNEICDIIDPKQLIKNYDDIIKEYKKIIVENKKAKKFISQQKTGRTKIELDTKNIKFLRDFKKMTFEEIAKKYNVSRNTIRNRYYNN